MTGLSTPWAPYGRRYSVPGSLVMKLELGEAPPRIAASLDVRAGHAEANRRTGLGAVDRILHRFSDHVAVTRVHSSARCLGRPGHRHLEYDEVEHCIGLSRTFRVDVDATCSVSTVADALRQLNEVEGASPNYLCATPFAPTYDDSDAQVDDRSRGVVNAWLAQAYEPGHPGVTVGILDTGIAPGRPGFATNVLPGIDTVQLGVGDLAAGFELLGDSTGIDTSPDDEVGHGTACAGIIGGAGNGTPPGLAGGCTILPVRVLGSVRPPGATAALGVGSPLDIDSGMKRAIDLNAKVLNLSFGTALDQLDPGDAMPHADIVRYGMARGCVMVAASGNSGREELYSPAVLPGVIAVGAVDKHRRPASFTTRGDHVALCAPGHRVVGLGRSGEPVRVTGTSFAAPFVTAAAALLVSRSLRRAQPLDAADVRRLLCGSAQPWPPGTPSGMGAGVLDVIAALGQLDAVIDRRPNRSRDGPTSGDPPIPPVRIPIDRDPNSDPEGVLR